MRAAMRRLQRLENKKKQDRHVIFRFHLSDGRVVDSAMNELPQSPELTEDCTFIDFSESDLYV
jgi:hypothetical protein